MASGLPLVWIVGSSIVRRLQEHIRERHLDVNLGLPCTVRWMGRGGRRGEDLLPLLTELHAATNAESDAIVVHLGGNSISFDAGSRRGLFRQMKEDVLVLLQLFPRSLLVFSDILPRRSCRFQRRASGYSMERTQRWLNGVMRGFMEDLGMAITVHPNITLDHLLEDAVIWLRRETVSFCRMCDRL